MGTVSRVRQQRVSNLVKFEKVRDERKVGEMRGVYRFCCDEKGHEMGRNLSSEGKTRREKKKRDPDVAPFASCLVASSKWSFSWKV